MFPMKLSHRIQQVSASPTIAITTAAKQMQADGIDVISFGAGEPDFDTPQFIKDATVAALTAGRHEVYAPRRGGPEEGHRREDDPGQRRADPAGRSPRDLRRQARPVRGVPGDRRPRRDGPDPLAVLGELPRAGQARRRGARHPPRRARAGLQDHPAADPRRRRRRGRSGPEQPQQPDRRDLQPRGTRRHRRGRPEDRPDRPVRRDLREAHLRPDEVRQLREPRPAPRPSGR